MAVFPAQKRPVGFAVWFFGGSARLRNGGAAANGSPRLVLSLADGK
jgi:hypothetical protein